MAYLRWSYAAHGHEQFVRGLFKAWSNRKRKYGKGRNPILWLENVIDNPSKIWDHCILCCSSYARILNEWEIFKGF